MNSDSPRPPETSTTASPSWLAPVAPVVPDHDMIRRVGGGSYGDVWLARTTVGTWRAVKVVFRDRFTDARPYEREYRGIQKFEPLSRGNEAFVDVLQIGRNDEEGYFYYVMELADDAAGAPTPGDKGEGEIPGGTTVAGGGSSTASIRRFSPDGYVPRTLAKVLLQRGRLAVSECLELGLTLNLGLAHLHKAGLIHRDIKPSNIIFVGGVPKLADIGLVIELAEARSYVGTEGFIPPEGPNSPRADLYSLGKVLYEAGMGKDRKDFPEPFTQISAAPDSEQLLEFNSILLKACAANVKDRYQSAEEMNADLALLQSGGSVRRQRRLAGQLRFVQRAGAVVTVLAAVIALGWWWQARQTHVVRELAAQKSQLAEEKTKLAEENRHRIVRLDIANGVRLLDEGDPAGALLWFADALPLLTNNPAQESIHRIRIQQTLDQVPRLLRLLQHESSVHSALFSPDGRFIATGTMHGQIRVWNAADGSLVWGPKTMGADAVFLRFSRDGSRLFASSSLEQWAFNGNIGFRNFYAVLDATSGREMFSSHQTESAPSTNLICAHFSPDDRWLVTAGNDNCIRVLDLADGRLVRELRGHHDEVRFLSFTADGSVLASASLDRTVRLWRLPMGEPIGPPLEHRFPVVRALLTGDGQHVITGSFENPGSLGNSGSEAGKGEIQVWDTASGRRVGEPIRKRDWLLMYLNLADPRRFYGPDSAYQIGSTVEPLFKVKAGAVQSWVFSRGNRWLAVGEAEKAARVMDATTGKVVAGPFQHGGEVSAIQISPDEQLLLTACGDGNARIWKLQIDPGESGRRVLPAPMEQMDPVAMESQVGRSPGGMPIPLKNGRGLWLFNEKLEAVRQLESSQLDFNIIQSASHSDFWITWQFDNAANRLVLYRSPDAAESRVLLDHPGRILEAAFAGEDQFLVTLCEDQKLRFWRTADGGLDRTITLPNVSVYALSPDGKTVLCVRGTREGHPVFEFLDLESGEIIGESNIIIGAIFRADFSPGGQRLALLDRNGPVTILEARSGRVISSTIGHTANLMAVEWSHALDRLLTVGHDDQVAVWNVETGEQALGTLRTPGTSIRAAKWSPDDRFIITYSKNKTARVWDATTGEAVTPSLKHDGEVAFAFMTDSRRLITASYPDMLRAWDLRETTLAAGVLADYAKLISSRRLGTAGTLLSLRSAEMEELKASLRVRSPQLFE